MICSYILGRSLSPAITGKKLSLIGLQDLRKGRLSSPTLHGRSPTQVRKAAKPLIFCFWDIMGRQKAFPNLFRPFHDFHQIFHGWLHWRVMGWSTRRGQPLSALASVTA